jgi:Raf kinase inhibitor-like YbhB/YbcL family protein
VRLCAGQGRSRSATAAVAVITSVLLLGGCGLLGKPPRQNAAAAPLTMSVTTPDFAGHIIPPAFTCDSTDEAGPTIFWSGAPPGTKSLALVVDDAAAPISPYVNWIVYDISNSTTDLPLGTPPPHAREAENSTGKATYAQPCPFGSPHEYRFTVYALNTYFVRALPDGSPLLTAWTTIAQHVIARGTFTATARALPGSPHDQRSHSVGPATDAAGEKGAAIKYIK